jgi:hypothetical protein
MHYSYVVGEIMLKSVCTENGICVYSRVYIFPVAFGGKGRGPNEGICPKACVGCPYC